MTKYTFTAAVIAVFFLLTFQLSQRAIPLLNGTDADMLYGIGLVVVIIGGWVICTITVIRSYK